MESPVKTPMVKLTPAQRAEAHYWFEQYFQLGFFGRQFLHLKNIRKAIGYEGSDQSFSKLWILWMKAKFDQQDAEIKAAVEELDQRVADAIKENTTKEEDCNG
jgi:hypothetical protein